MMCLVRWDAVVLERCCEVFRAMQDVDVDDLVEEKEASV